MSSLIGGITDRYELFGRRTDDFCLCFGEVRGEGKKTLFFIAIFDDIWPCFFDVTGSNMSDFNFFGHADDADWFFF